MSRLKTLADIQQQIASKTVSLPEIVDFYLQNIENTQSLNIYVEVFAAEARERARILTEKYAANPQSVGKLFGCVVSIKDVICYEGHEVTAASKILRGFKSQFSATAVERLLAEDAIIIGRTNCDQFAMGSDSTNSIYGAVRNAADPERVAGGSSGGSAVSVQADTCLVALGSDTGGSVRQPAAFCGVVGFKPTYGRISRHGLLAYGSSFDQIGLLAHRVEDVAKVLEIIAGADDFDATASQKPVETYAANIKNKQEKYRIAYLEGTLDNLDPDILAATQKTIDILRGGGNIVEKVPFSLLEYLVPAYYVLTTAEASSNLSRYDGVRYGHRAEGTKTLDETYRRTRTEGFSAEVKRRIMLGTFVLSAGFYDAYYAKAQKVRRLLADRTFDIFKEYDFILMPASPIKAWKIGEKTADPVAMYLADIFTVQANMVGCPAVALPIGTDAEGLPIGVQFVANKFDEDKLLAFSNGFEDLRI